ncbi:CAMK family protein kinase [Colletotrichum tofieldiae]|uniref:CAMK family protein kinase n=1 Tax=Colletotrichum tofieldiae TaxID=708197 RepID=A0A166WU99_9PEZI|nr:CAMK family protein kinase [Colletotrichum tofieldiae]GKT54304.1 CAMK family protein kinase [Colletotrichum tofieldiae]GKT74026.1 CAMK family protein kinase [Colletotrichum tofieldiae]
MSITSSHTQISRKGILHTVEAYVGGEKCLSELYDSYRYVPAHDIDASCTKDATIVKLICLNFIQKRKLKKFAAKEMWLSREACCRTIVRYLDYLPSISAIVSEKHPRDGAIHPARDRFGDGAILNIAWDLLLALAYLHSRGIIHGDVRPRNVIPFPSYPRRDRHKLFGHGLVPDVISYWPKDDGYTAPEFLPKNAGTCKKGKQTKEVMKPTFESDIWQLGMLLWHCHRYGTHWDSEIVPSRKNSWQSESLLQPDLTLDSENSMKGIRPLAFRAKGCEGSSHDWLQQLLRNMLDENPLGRSTAMELLQQMQSQRSHAVEKKELEEDVEDMKDAVEAAKKENWERSPLGKVVMGAKRVQVDFTRLILLISLLCHLI